LGYTAPPPAPNIVKMQGDPLSGFSSHPECHQCPRQASFDLARGLVEVVLQPSEVFSPSAFSQSRGATYTRWLPNHRLRCAPRVSHPLDALLPSRPAGPISSRYRSWGFTLRGLTPLRVPYVLSNAASLSKLASGPKTLGPSLGLGTPERSRPDPTVLPANPANAPLGLGPFEVYCPASQSSRVATFA
jgi:hypothetical protein